MNLNLVLQTPDPASADIEQIAALAGSDVVERLGGSAVRLRHARKDAAITAYCDTRGIDYGWVPEGRRFADLELLAMDMDSTLITIECIDELGDLAGKKVEIAEITGRAMRGEIEYRESLRRRVKSLAGLPESSLQEIYDQRLKLTFG